MKLLGYLVRHHCLKLFWLCILLFAAIFASYITRYNPNLVNVSERLQPPSLAHFFGTDEYGRDLFTRVVYGSRVVFYVVILSAIFSAIAGTLIGLVAGYFGGKADLVLSRLIEGVQSFPSALIGIMMAAAIGPSLNTAILSVGIRGTPVLARVVRGEVLRIREMDYIEASRALGASRFHIITKEILRNVLSPIIIQVSSVAPRAIIAVAGLSFLGLGAQPPRASWGAMISYARVYMYQHPIYLIIVLSVLSITIIALNMLGDGIRDFMSRSKHK